MFKEVESNVWTTISSSEFVFFVSIPVGRVLPFPICPSENMTNAITIFFAVFLVLVFNRSHLLNISSAHPSKINLFPPMQCPFFLNINYDQKKIDIWIFFLDMHLNWKKNTETTLRKTASFIFILMAIAKQLKDLKS